MIRLGIIGCGGRMQQLLGLVKRLNAGTEIAAVTEIRGDAVKRQMAEAGLDVENTRFYTDADEMLDVEQVDGVMIGSRCSTHSMMAQKALKRNLPLFLEKPVATNMEDLLALRDAQAKSASQVVVSFPMRVTPLMRLVKEIIDSGKIGTVEHVEAWNDVFYALVYYMYWYRDENETQGLFIQKATHDFDYINYLLGIQPRWITAITSKQVFKGDRPAGLTCDDCREWDSCLESPFHIYARKAEADEVKPGVMNMCCFAKDTGNEDSGSALIEYETGMHVSYTQDFIVRKDAGRRGARLIGYKGTVEFDQHTNEVKVYMHHANRVETHKVQADACTHGGGDTVLVDNFIRVIRGEQHSVAPLDAGLLSILMCLKAKESAATRTFQEIKFPERGIGV
ncbi:MAG: Gfo/Idh/MocA family oxidoreductase [Armatimonadetes bacterium]|nr:Gfo/Idh/MocA family oxidoreductase [Armatimonadota bacterium]